MSEGIQLAEGETRKLLLAKMEERERARRLFHLHTGLEVQGRGSAQSRLKGWSHNFLLSL